MENTVSESSRTLWIGDLQAWMDDNYLNSLLQSLGYAKELTAIKLIKDKTTGIPAKYGFLEFNTHSAADHFYQNYNNRLIPNSHKLFKLNWAAYGGGTKPSNINANKTSPQEMSIYIGQLDPSITEHKLLEMIKSKYPSAFMSKIITDNVTKVSKGYGFVKFTNHEEAHRAITQMNGQVILGRTLKVSNAFMKNKEDNSQADSLSEETETQLQQRQKLYAQFYSMVNDPQLKAEYEKQIQKTFGNEDSNKKHTLKHSLEGVRSLTYNQTIKSQTAAQIPAKECDHKCEEECGGAIV